MKSWVKPAAIAASSLTLLACGSSLIWKATYPSDYSSTASALAVDANNNIYVGGGQRLSGDSIFDLEYVPTLIKYDDAGALVWDLEIPGSSLIKHVKPLTSDLLLVVTQAEYSYGWVVDDKVGELWLVSADDGELVNQLDTFEAQKFVNAEVVGDQIYVAKSTGSSDLICLFSCGPLDYESTLSVYSLAGTQLNSVSYLKEIDGFDVDAQGDLYVVYHNKEASKLNANLATLWQVGADAMAECEDPKGIKSAAGGAWIACYNGVIHVTDAGVVSALTDFSDYLVQEDTPSGDVLRYEYWVHADKLNMNQNMAVDSDNNLYLSVARNTVYGNGEQIGGVSLNDPSVIESDAVIFKVDVGSGDILWSDDINTPHFGTSNGFVAYYYYPMSIHLNSDNQPLLSFRGFKGDYLGYDGVEASCAGADDILFYINMCHLNESLDRYAKTVKYDADTGERVADVRFDMAYPRAVAVNPEGEVLVAGDAASELISVFNEFFTRGIGQLGEDMPLTEDSAILLEKRKL